MTTANGDIEVDYAAAGVPVRGDLLDAHRWMLGHIRAPGTWWTGAERVAIASAARAADACSRCRARKAALSPNAVTGEHHAAGPLPASVVDAIHRVRTDPARLSKPWFDGVIAGGLDMPHYVELIGVVTMITGMDYFARALGVLPPALPEALPGEPSRHLPAAARPGEAWVPMIALEDAAGPEADVYGGLPMVPNIVRALSLVPDEVRALQRSSAAHYLPISDIPDPTVRRALDRMQMELVAARVSALNQCFY
jgi:hypothetical protein